MEKEPKSLKATFTYTNCVKVSSSDCPLGRLSCWDELGEYKKKCGFCKGFYEDTQSVICEFNLESDESKLTLMPIIAKMAGKW